MIDDLTNRLTDFCIGLSDDGYAPHGVAIIFPESDEDAALIQEYGNNPERLRRLIAQDGNMRRDLEIAESAVVNQRGTIEAHETYIRELQAELSETRVKLESCASLAPELANVREDCDRLNADNERLTRTIEELRDGLNGATDVADRRAAKIEALRADLTHAEQTIGRVSGLLSIAEYRLAVFGYRPQ